MNAACSARHRVSSSTGAERTAPPSTPRSMTKVSPTGSPRADCRDGRLPRPRAPTRRRRAHARRRHLRSRPTARPSCCSTAAARPATPGAARPACSATRAGGPPPSTCAATATATGPARATASGYTLDEFAADVRAVAAVQSRPPVLIGASLGGISSLVAIGEAPAGTTVASRARARRRGAAARGEGHRAHRRVHARQPRRLRLPRGGGRRRRRLQPAPAPAHRPVGPAQERPPPRRRPLVLALGPARSCSAGASDETRSVRNEDRLEDAARALTVPTLLVRGRQSDVLSEEGARETLELVPHARSSTSAAPATWWRATATTPSTTRCSSSCARSSRPSAPTGSFVRGSAHSSAQNREENCREAQPMRSSGW